MKVLLLDDKVKHRRAGRRQLEALGHDVVPFSSYYEAQEATSVEEFDAALIDLLMPAEAVTLGSEAQANYLGVSMGVGYPVAIAMARFGTVPLIACATDTNHHNHPMSAIMDWFSRGTLQINDSKVMLMHAPMAEGGVKDWAEVLRRLTAE